MIWHVLEKLMRAQQIANHESLRINLNLQTPVVEEVLFIEWEACINLFTHDSCFLLNFNM